MKLAESLSSKAYLWLGLFFSVFIWSGIEPKDRLTWVLEAGPAIIGLWVMAKTRSSFPLTPLLYFWILLKYDLFRKRTFSWQVRQNLNILQRSVAAKASTEKSKARL